MDKGLQELVDTVEAWQLRRMSLAAAFTTDGLREFAATHNALTRKLIVVVDRNDPEFWSAFLELCQQAGSMTAGGKFFVEKQDRTNL